MFELYDVVILPMVIGLVELFKRMGVPNKVLPLVALVYGLAAGIFYIAPNDLKQGILVGVMLGLSASGLYSAGKTLKEKDDK